VSQQQAPPHPPSHLTARSQQLWAELVVGQVTTPERRTLLQAALEDLDRVDEIRALLATEGLLMPSKRGLPRPHPALKLEAEARRRFISAWRALQLNSGRAGPVGGQGW
jgi:hypothetical protein